MECLLVSHDGRLRSALKLDLRKLRQKFWFRVRFRMTIATVIYDRRIWILLKQVRRQGSCPVCRPHCFVWRMLERLGCRLRRVVTFDTRNRLRPIDAAILGYVIEVVELNRSKFRLSPQRDYFRRFLTVLS